MPKVTVYIPDDLLGRARALPDGDKTSQIVQKGLARLLDDSGDDAPAYATRPDGAEEKILALREKFLEEAEREYATGYSAAVEVAEALPLWSLNQLARLRFNIPVWLKGYAEAAHQELLERSKGHEIDIAQLSSTELADLFASFGRLPQPKPEESQWWWVWQLAKVLGFLANPLDFDEGAFDPTNARVRGFADALRDLWDAIESPGNSRIDHSVEFMRKFRETSKTRQADLAKAWKAARAQRAGRSDDAGAEKGGDDG